MDNRTSTTNDLDGWEPTAKQKEAAAICGTCFALIVVILIWAVVFGKVHQPPQKRTAEEQVQAEVK